MDIKKHDTAVVFTNPQNEVSRDKDRGRTPVADSVKESKTVENMEYRLEKPKEVKVSIGELYGCLCHQVSEDVPTSGSSGDKD